MILRGFENANGKNHESNSAFPMFGYGIFESHMWDRDQQILLVSYLEWRNTAYDS